MSVSFLRTFSTALGGNLLGFTMIVFVSGEITIGRPLALLIIVFDLIIAGIVEFIKYKIDK